MKQLVLFLLAILLSATAVAENASRPVLLAKLEELNGDSARLVGEARSAQAKATPFRIDVTLYRESLRTLMLSNREIGEEKDRIPQDTLINMVRMSALLNSAAECKTGRYIVCPPELMTKLTTQQQLLSEDLDHLKAIPAGAD
ncbi:MAG: hypothetical protein OEU91_09615 [Gammaproteobacteria bacterium]|nr:hypothetical protein [Gammaproteobacteria bacterium]